MKLDYFDDEVLLFNIEYHSIWWVILRTKQKCIVFMVNW
jgi:hypothetical protein